MNPTQTRSSIELRRFALTQVFLFSFLFFLSGCFETHFDFKTVIHPNGSVDRVMEMKGQSAHLFKAPQGMGWQSKVWESKGEGTLIGSTIYHQKAEGHFQPLSQIPSDYKFHLEEVSKSWDEETQQKLSELGIHPPYADSFYSRNQIRIQVIDNLLTKTIFYEETFENAGIIETLFSDLKKHVEDEARRNEQSFSEAEIEVMANLRLEEEILNAFTFTSEVQFPGKIISTNAHSQTRNRAQWKFSMKDFENHHSIYVLKAASRVFLLPGWILLGVAGFIFFVAVFGVLAGIKRRAKERKKKRPKRPSRSGEDNP